MSRTSGPNGTGVGSAAGASCTLKAAAAEERTVHHIGEGDLDPFPRVVRRGNGAQRPGVVERAGQAREKHGDERVELAGRQIAHGELRADAGHALVTQACRPRVQPVVLLEDGRQRPEDRPVPLVDVRVVPDPVPQVLPTGRLGRQRLNGLRRGADLAGHLPREAAEDVLFAREVLVERHPRAVRPLRYPGDAAPMEALVAEELQRGIEDSLPGSLPSLPDLGVVRERGTPRHRLAALAQRRRRDVIPSCHHDTVRTAPATGTAPGAR